MDASLGDGDGLLFHGFVNSHLITDVHFVELVDGTNAASVLKSWLVSRESAKGFITYSKHQSTGFDGKFAGIGVLDN